MPVLAEIPVLIDPLRVRRALRLPGDESGDAFVRDLLALARPLIHARALFREAFIDRREDAEIEIEGLVFQSRVLRRNLADKERIFPYLVTVGEELEKAASKEDDLFRQYAMEMIADLALESAADRLETDLRERFGIDKLSALNPGSLEDWPIEQQVPLFRLLGDTEKRLGVRLSDSLLMIPRKSVSGILFPVEESFSSCRLCPRPHCHGRRAAFDPALRKAYGLEDPV
jgi:hypothetical protein